MQEEEAGRQGIAGERDPSPSPVPRFFVSGVQVASHTDDSKRKRREDRLRDWKDEVLSEAELQLIREVRRATGGPPPLHQAIHTGYGSSSSSHATTRCAAPHCR